MDGEATRSRNDQLAIGLTMLATVLVVVMTLGVLVLVRVMPATGLSLGPATGDGPAHPGHPAPASASAPAR